MGKSTYNLESALHIRSSSRPQFLIHRFNQLQRWCSTIVLYLLWKKICVYTDMGPFKPVLFKGQSNKFLMTSMVPNWARSSNLHNCPVRFGLHPTLHRGKLRPAAWIVTQSLLWTMICLTPYKLSAIVGCWVSLDAKGLGIFVFQMSQLISVSMFLITLLPVPLFSSCCLLDVDYVPGTKQPSPLMLTSLPTQSSHLTDALLER